MTRQSPNHTDAMYAGDTMYARETATFAHLCRLSRETYAGDPHVDFASVVDALKQACARQHLQATREQIDRAILAVMPHHADAQSSNHRHARTGLATVRPVRSSVPRRSELRVRGASSVSQSMLFGEDPNLSPLLRFPPRPGVYQTIYADPPWYESGGGQIKRGADRHYPLMKTDAIAAIPVTLWAAPDAHLYCWITNNFLEDGLQVVEAWGFRYVTMVSWFKDRIGLGQYYRGRTEHCLFAVRGRVPYQVLESGKRAQGATGFEDDDPDLQDFSATRGEHSVKPEQMRTMIERVSPGPYLELFARRPAPGWDLWGFDAPST